MERHIDTGMCTDREIHTRNIVLHRKLQKDNEIKSERKREREREI